MDELTEQEKNLLEQLKKPKYTFKEVEQKIEEYRKKKLFIANVLANGFVTTVILR